MPHVAQVEIVLTNGNTQQRRMAAVLPLREGNSKYLAYWVGWRLREMRSAEEIDQTMWQGNILYRA